MFKCKHSEQLSTVQKVEFPQGETESNSETFELPFRPQAKCRLEIRKAPSFLITMDTINEDGRQD